MSHFRGVKTPLPHPVVSYLGEGGTVHTTVTAHPALAHFSLFVYFGPQMKFCSWVYEMKFLDLEFYADFKKSQKKKF